MRNVVLSSLFAVATVLSACSSGKTDSDSSFCVQENDSNNTTITATCTDTTGTYNVGDMWTCADGCNTCGCLEADVIASTSMTCDSGGTTDTGTTDTGTSAG